MRKAELESHHSSYSASEAQIRELLDAGEYPRALHLSPLTFEHMVPALKYRKSNDEELDDDEILPLEVICAHAPYLFEHAIIELAQQHVKGTRSLSKHPRGYVDKLEKAIESEEVARRLWNSLAAEPNVKVRSLFHRFDDVRPVANHVLHYWQHLGVIQGHDATHESAIALCTTLDAEVGVICPGCGAKGRGRKEQVFKSIVCNRCGTHGYAHAVFDI